MINILFIMRLLPLLKICQIVNCSSLIHHFPSSLHLCHSVCFQFPFPRGLDYLSGALAFAWYGYGFTFHANSPDRLPLDKIMHILPVCVIYGVALCIMLEIWFENNFILHVSSESVLSLFSSTCITLRLTSKLLHVSNISDILHTRLQCPHS